MKYVLIVMLIVLVSCNGCRDKRETGEVASSEQMMKDLIEFNKSQHENEMKEIKTFISNKKWPMTETGTGMNYWIYEKGSGQSAELDDFASITYKVELLDGTVCYEAKKDKPGVFKIGQDAVESGIHEVVLLMKVGDKARVVLPSHLAFGLTGDSSKIPKSSPLVYDIELIALN